MRTIEQLLADLKRIQRGGGDTEDVDAELAQHGYVNKDAHRGGSRFVGEGASPDLVKHVAAGGKRWPWRRVHVGGGACGHDRREGGRRLAGRHHDQGALGGHAFRRWCSRPGGGGGADRDADPMWVRLTGTESGASVPPVQAAWTYTLRRGLVVRLDARHDGWDAAPEDLAAALRRVTAGDRDHESHSGVTSSDP